MATASPAAPGGGGGGEPASVPDAPAAAPQDGGEVTAAARADPPAAGAAAQAAIGNFGAMFSGWMAQAGSVAASAAAAVAPAAGDAAPRATAGDAAGDAAGNAVGNAAVDAAGDAAGATAPLSSTEPPPHARWLEDAGKMFETAVAGVGERLEAAKLDEKVGALRETSSVFLGDVSKNIETSLQSIDSDALRERAAEIETSAKGILASASNTIQSKTKEALDLFVDADPANALTGTGGVRTNGIEAAPTASSPAVAPWDHAALPESERKYADALRQAMLKTVVDSIYSKNRRRALFLSGQARAAGFTFDADANAAEALAVLEADHNVRRLRSGLVPQKISEAVFWNEYFYHVKRLRTTLVANAGVIPAGDDAASVDESDKALFGDDDDDDEEEELAGLYSPVRRPVRKPVDDPVIDTDEIEVPEPGVLDFAGTAAPKAGEKGDSLATPSTEVLDWENEIDALFDDTKDKL